MLAGDAMLLMLFGGLLLSGSIFLVLAWYGVRTPDQRLGKTRKERPGE